MKQVNEILFYLRLRHAGVQFILNGFGFGQVHYAWNPISGSWENCR